ncbi:hypothetical protein [Lactococcus fujiensis]|uniref:hypothetical protein n=1 Tax=Lactococcus fujiensis TaxID=610251 RepID=UPI002092DB30|nr:hypothetical protein [Lactococcus fujiensis]
MSTAKLTLLLLIAGYSAVHLHSPLMFVRIIVEVFLILALTQILGHKFNSLPIRIIKYLLSSLLILFSLIDAIVATFSGTYLTVLMTQNLANIMDLGGNLWLYGSAALLVILAAFLPMRYNLFNKKTTTCKHCHIRNFPHFIELDRNTSNAIIWLCWLFLII